MAIYHASTQSISRGAGRSAVAAAAYRAGVELTDARTGLIHDYTRREQGSILSADILLPDGSSVDREALWNAAEQAEKRKDARTAREWVIALPAELNADERQALAHDFAGQLAQRYGVAVDVSIHQPDKAGDQRNHHAHILTTTRQVSRGDHGEPILGEKATIELSDTKRRGLGLGPVAEEITALRQLWEQTANRHLERAGHEERIDHRSLKAQGQERAPTTHLGPHVVQMERRGIETERGERHRARLAMNAQIIDLAEARQRLETQRQAEKEGPPALTHRDRINAAVADFMRRDLDELYNSLQSSSPMMAQKPAQPDPQAIKDAWQQEKQTQFYQIEERARKLQNKAFGQWQRQERKIARHDQLRPERPRGLLAGLKMKTYEKAYQAWSKIKGQLERRLRQLEKRIERLSQYMRRAGPYELATPGEKLALKKAEQARPELAKEHRQVIERETEQRRAELLEQFKQKERPDRSNERGGRGR